MATTVALLFQNVGQVWSDPASASVILSLESVFGVLCSVIFYGDPANRRPAGGLCPDLCGRDLLRDQVPLSAPEIGISGPERGIKPAGKVVRPGGGAFPSRTKMRDRGLTNRPAERILHYNNQTL